MPRLWWYFTAPACCGCHGRSSLYKTSLLRMPCYDVGAQVCCGCHGCGGILQHRLAADAMLRCWSTSLLRMPRLWWYFTAPACCGCHGCAGACCGCRCRSSLYKTSLLRMPCSDVGTQDTSLLRMPWLWWYFTAPACCGCHGRSSLYKTSLLRMPCYHVGAQSAADATVVVVFYSTGLLRMPRSAADATAVLVGTPVCCGCHGCGGILQHRLAADATVAAAFTRPVCCGCHGCASWNASLLRMPRLWWYFRAPACCGCHGRSSLYKTSLLRMPCSLQGLAVQACRGCHGYPMMLEHKSAADAAVGSILQRQSAVAAASVAIAYNAGPL